MDEERSVCSQEGYDALPARVRHVLGGLSWEEHIAGLHERWEADPAALMRPLDAGRAAAELAVCALEGEDEDEAWEHVHRDACALVPAASWEGGVEEVLATFERLKGAFGLVSELVSLHRELEAEVGESHTVLVGAADLLLRRVSDLSPIPQQISVRVTVHGDEYGVSRVVEPDTSDALLVALLALGLVHEGVVLAGSEEPDGWQMRSWRVGVEGLLGQPGEMLSQVVTLAGEVRACHTPADILVEDLI